MKTKGLLVDSSVRSVQLHSDLTNSAKNRLLLDSLTQTFAAAKIE